MISIPLFKRNMFSCCKIGIIFLAILMMYNSVIIYMFDPDLADMLNGYQEALPEMMAAVGMTGACKTLIQFVHTYLYGFIMLIIPLVFVVIITNKLVMKYIDNGSMVCLLSTPNSRSTIIMTQMLSIILSILFLISATAALSYLCAEMMFPGDLDLSKYMQLNISCFLFAFAMGGIAFFAACIFNQSKGYFVLGAGLPMIFYLIQMMANMGGDLENLKYGTIFTLFPGEQIISSKSGVFRNDLILGGIGLLLYIIGAIHFTKKDLPL
ncbi:MAG: ABC transporter permease subunit [Lachnospiraceae bacterium]